MRIPNRKIAGLVLAGTLAVGGACSSTSPGADKDAGIKVVSNGAAPAGVLPTDLNDAASTTTTAPSPTTTTAVRPTTTTTRLAATTTTAGRVTTTTVPARSGNCDPSYPDVCVPSGADLDCPDIPYKNFRVVGSDPHRFDADNDGIGCEKN